MYAGSLNEITPTVNFASRSTAQPGDQWGPRMIPDCQFFFVISGEAHLRLGADEYAIKPGECVFYGAQSPHVLSSVEHTEYFSIHFSWHEASPVPVHPAYGLRNVSADELRRKAAEYRLEVPGAGVMAMPHHFPLPDAEELMMNIVREYRQEAPGSPFLLRALLMQLIVSVLRRIGKRPASGAAYGRIAPALSAMQEQPGRSWSVAELAKRCGYHPSYFTRVFYQETGSNPKQYLISERIKLAKQALLRGEPVEAIAERLGYASIHYFSNNFKKETGLSPSEYRQTPVSAGGLAESDKNTS
jgi:AraC-like DNA-binding protein